MIYGMEFIPRERAVLRPIISGHGVTFVRPPRECDAAANLTNSHSIPRRLMRKVQRV